MTPIDWSVRSYRRRLLDGSLERVARDLAGVVLEIGAGRSGRRGRFRPPSGTRWVTGDLDLRHRPDVQADVLSLPFADSIFDAALCLEVLEYVRDPVAAARELVRVIRPGGRAIISVPFLHRWDAPDDRWRWTPAGLRQLMEAAGLSIESELAQGGAFTTVASVVREAALAPAGRWHRRVASLAAYPLSELLFHADARWARGPGVLSTFSTGYLAVGRKA